MNFLKIFLLIATFQSVAWATSQSEALAEALAQRQIGFLIPVDDKPPLDIKKFKTVECQYDIQCYPVYSIKNKNIKNYEIRGVDERGKEGKVFWVKEGELPFKYQNFEDFLNSALMDFIGETTEIKSNMDNKAQPIWMNYSPGAEKPLKEIDVIAVKRKGDQIWLQVDFIKEGRCDSAEKTVIGRGWIPVFKADHSFNIKWYPRGC